MDRPNRLRSPQVREDLVKAYLYVQQKYEDEGQIPRDRGTLLSRYRSFWETMGAIHLGMLIAVVSIWLNFIVINFLLHLPPS